MRGDRRLMRGDSLPSVLRQMWQTIAIELRSNCDRVAIELRSKSWRFAIELRSNCDRIAIELRSKSSCFGHMAIEIFMFAIEVFMFHQT